MDLKAATAQNNIGVGLCRVEGGGMVGGKNKPVPILKHVNFARLMRRQPTIYLLDWTCRIVEDPFLYRSTGLNLIIFVVFYVKACRERARFNICCTKVSKLTWEVNFWDMSAVR